MSTFLLIFFKFFVVGGFGFGIDVLTTFLFKEKLKLQKYTANSIGFFIGVVFRFFANKYWSFQNESQQWFLQILQFSIIALIGLALVNGLIYLFNEKFSLMNFYPAKIIAMIVFMLWNFTANYFWTFA